MVERASPVRYLAQLPSHGSYLANSGSPTMESQNESHSRRLRQRLDMAIPAVSAATAAVVTHPQFREIYPDFLITLHQLIRATVPVMETSLRRCRELADSDPVAAA